MDGLYQVTSDVREASEIIIRNMIATRPQGSVKYRPYRVSEAVFHDSYLGWQHVDLKKIYPQAQVGDYVCVGFNLVSGSDSDITFAVKGNPRVFHEKRELIVTDKKQDYDCYNFAVKKGDNEICLWCECQNENEFMVSFIPSTVQYPTMWARDYLLCLDVHSPISEFAVEEGIGVSSLYKGKDQLPRRVEYVWPRSYSCGAIVDMNAVFPDSKGAVAYALTYAMENTQLKLDCEGETTLFVNGAVRNQNSPIIVQKGDTILLKLCKAGGKFGVIQYNEGALIGIPFLESNRSGGDKWLTLGTFGTEEDKSLAFGPEIEVQFTRPYTDCNWQQIFWKLNDKDDCIRPYVDSFFYSQWFYAIMVGHYGILKASSLLKNQEYQNYFIDSISNLALFFEYAGYESRTFNRPTFLGRSTNIKNLDNTGSMGMNLCELYKLTQDQAILSCLKTLSDTIWNVIPRFEDGTFYRGSSMWADDIFMCCPMLVRMGHVLHDSKYFDEVVRQIRGFKKRLWRKDAKLFSHILFVEQNRPNEVSWGRGNGWIFVSLADMLEKLPSDTEGREELCSLFREFAESLLLHQDEDGLWHQVIDHPESYQETSGTAMFLWGMSLGIRLGILPEKEFIRSAERAYYGLLKHKIDKQGNVYDVCRGSGMSMDAEYYKQLGPVTNDDHGTGLILAAFEAYSHLKKRGMNKTI